MEKNHDFSFEGGNILKKMGASWFVSYAYFENVDNNHLNWQLVQHKGRISVYNNSKSYHREWLYEILNMNDKKLSTNKIFVTPFETKKMAKMILEKS